MEHEKQAKGGHVSSAKETTVGGAAMIVRPLEVSRERAGPHSWRVTLSDGSTEELISWDGCWKEVPRAVPTQRKPTKRK
jgi:hypothetical protein